MRFDDTRTLLGRKQRDDLILIRKTRNSLLLCSKKLYIPSCNTTIDKQLAGFPGRFPFRIYPLKTIEYAATTSLSFFNYEDNLGRTSPERKACRRGRIVATFWIRKNKNMDNFFTSIPLKLLRSNVTLTGTIRSNKREILQS